MIPSVNLIQIDKIRLQPPQRFIDLSHGSDLISAIDLGHQEGFLAITIAQRSAHSNFALSVVVVPAIIEKIDSFIDSGANDANALVGIALIAQVIPTEPDKRNPFAGAAQSSIGNSVLAVRLCGSIDPSGY